ncbi:MAG TPA: hypothetical protein DER33_07085 [Syntrophomonas sp.]|nr:hypothetical protein [Syntrophomonas sp.]HCF71327.1 hypothetical protein [Syntrophomonas sp.]
MVIAKTKWILILLFFLILVTVPQAAAANTEWTILWKDNDNLIETVQIEKQAAALEPDGWQSIQTSQGTMYKRDVKGWEQYAELSDRLPVSITINDYFLFKSITFKGQDFNPEAVSVAGQAGTGPLDLRLSVPGLIKSGSADEVKDLTAVWHLKNLNELNTQGTILVVNTFNGFILGIYIIILGILIIGIVYFSRIRKTHKLIEKEYSLENLTLPTEQPEEKE